MENQEAYQAPEYLFAASGKPFKTEKAALSAVTQKGLKHLNNWSVVQFPTKDDPLAESSWAIQFNNTGEVGPAPNLTNQPNQPNQPNPTNVQPKEDVYVEKYFMVRFHAKAQPNDPEDVILSVNGETLILQREKKIVIPGRFRECADHATYPQFRQLPNKPRKIVATVRVFPYDYLGDSTEAEFLRQKRDGDKITKKNIALYGPNVTPEDLE